MRNENFHSRIHSAGKSLYYISRHTGIPYTTLSRLSHDTLNINKCSGDVLLRLALFFDCKIEDLMNPEQLMAGVSGTYRGVRYRWVGKAHETELHINEDGHDQVIDAGDYSQNRFYRAYPAQAENLIDLYLSDRETEAMLNEE